MLTTLDADSPVAHVNVEISDSRPEALEEVITCQIGRYGVWGFGIFVRAPIQATTSTLSVLKNV